MSEKYGENAPSYGGGGVFWRIDLSKETLAMRRINSNHGLRGVNRAGILVAVAGLLAFSGAAFGQVDDAKAAAGKRGAPQPELRGDAERTSPFQSSGVAIISINFRGGTLAEYVAAVREAAGPDGTNVLFSQEAGSVSVPPVQLQSVSVRIALEVLEDVLLPSDVGRSLTVATHTDGEAAPVYSIQGAGGHQPSLTITNVLSLNSICKPIWLNSTGSEIFLSQDTALSAVETAVNLGSRGASAAEVRFHADSGLLMIVGTPDQVRTAELVLDQLRSDVRERRQSAPAQMTQQQFQPLSISATKLAQAMRDAFPSTGEGSPTLSVDGERVTVTGPQPMVEAARAVARLVDRVSTADPHLVEAEIRMMSMENELQRLRHELSARDIMVQEAKMNVEAVRMEAQRAMDQATQKAAEAAAAAEKEKTPK